MTRFPCIAALFAFMAIVSISGCVTYDPPPQESKPVPADTERWMKIPPKNWGTVSYHKRGEALSLLGRKDAVRIGGKTYEGLVAEEPDGFPAPKRVAVPAGWGLYLVKGSGYAVAGGKIRLNVKTGELSVFLVAYNGEMSFPGMRWPVEDLPVVVALPLSPLKIHKSAEIGGDSVSHLMDRD